MFPDCMYAPLTSAVAISRRISVVSESMGLSTDKSAETESRQAVNLSLSRLSCKTSRVLSFRFLSYFLHNFYFQKMRPSTVSVSEKHDRGDLRVEPFSNN